MLLGDTRLETKVETEFRLKSGPRALTESARNRGRNGSIAQAVAAMGPCDFLLD